MLAPRGRGWHAAAGQSVAAAARAQSREVDAGRDAARPPCAQDDLLDTFTITAADMAVSARTLATDHAANQSQAVAPFNPRPLLQSLYVPAQNPSTAPTAPVLAASASLFAY